MVPRVVVMAWLLVMLGAGVAQADIRIDPPPGSSPTPTTEPPSSPPRVEKQGCGAQRDQAPEWVVGLAVLGLGAWGLRRSSFRRVPA